MTQEEWSARGKTKNATTWPDPNGEARAELPFAARFYDTSRQDRRAPRQGSPPPLGPHGVAPIRSPTPGRGTRVPLLNLIPICFRARGTQTRKLITILSQVQGEGTKASPL